MNFREYPETGIQGVPRNMDSGSTKEHDSGSTKEQDSESIKEQGFREYQGTWIQRVPRNTDLRIIQKHGFREYSGTWIQRVSRNLDSVLQTGFNFKLSRKNRLRRSERIGPICFGVGRVKLILDVVKDNYAHSIHSILS